MMLSGAQKGSKDISSKRSRALSTSPQWTQAASAAFITAVFGGLPLAFASSNKSNTCRGENMDQYSRVH